jgi:hypothetical protein
MRTTGQSPSNASLDSLADHPFAEIFRLLVGQERLLQEQLDRLQKQLLTLRAYEKARAGLCWDADRKLDAEELGATLARRPTAVRAKLGRTKHGVLWLIGYWKSLMTYLDREPTWDEKRTSMAFDLLGILPALRHGEPWEAVGVDSARALAEREIATLEGMIADSLDGLDRFEQAAAIDDRPIHPTPAMKTLLREESACWRRFQAIQKEISKEAKHMAEVARIEDEPEPEPEPLRPSSPPRPPVMAAPLPSSPVAGNRRARRAALKRDRARSR